MPGSQCRQEMAEVAVGNLKGEAMASKLAEVENNPFDEDREPKKQTSY